jgi:hypothetical protein
MQTDIMIDVSEDLDHCSFLFFRLTEEEEEECPEEEEEGKRLRLFCIMLQYYVRNSSLRWYNIMSA